MFCPLSLCGKGIHQCASTLRLCGGLAETVTGKRIRDMLSWHISLPTFYRCFQISKLLFTFVTQLGTILSTLTQPSRLFATTTTFSMVYMHTFLALSGLAISHAVSTHPRLRDRQAIATGGTIVWDGRISQNGLVTDFDLTTGAFKPDFTKGESAYSLLLHHCFPHET